MSLEADLSEGLAACDGLIDRASDLRPLLQRIAEDFTALTHQAFAAHGPPGQPWPALDPDWAARKTGPPGVFTGMLQRAVTGDATIGADRIGLDAPPHVRYFTAARPIAPTDDDLVRRWIPMAEQHLTGAAGGQFDGMV
ncbi:phage virion morphogenesis protein [Euzebya rosea]|uniref:phage virion morphogenesis protein n=1 Tax=Euzebya rosea TaxID=2052804 RepID=UPI000D3EAF75|nr:phage virion morphogenesis protein [Euzebya rosea]